MRSLRRALWAAALAALAALAYLAVEPLLASRAPRRAGQATSRGPGAGHGRPGFALHGDWPGARVEQGLGDGHSPRGAVAASAFYLRLLDTASDSPPVRSALRGLTAPPLTRQALGALSESVALKRRLAGAGPVLARGWRLGYRVDSYTGSLARVEVWAMGIVQSRLEVLAAQYSTTTCTLAWQGRGWRVRSARTSPGPTPPVDGSDSSAVSAFVRAAGRFATFGDAP